MQPEEPYVSPPPPSPTPQQPSTSSPEQPDYSFLSTEKPKKNLRLPFVGNSFVGRIVTILVGALLLIILIVILKGFLTTPPFNKADYLLLIERQQEMLHILKTDVTTTNTTELSPSEQNFVATANAALNTAQYKTIGLMADYHDKVNLTKLGAIGNAAVDEDLASSLQTNTFSNAFGSQMQAQLSSYEQDIKAAYSSTHSAAARLLLTEEYNEAKLLTTALGSATS